MKGDRVVSGPVRTAILERWAWRPDGQQILAAGVMALLVFLICGPLAIMLWASVNPSWLFDANIEITLANYLDLLRDPLLFQALRNTFAYGLIASVLGVALGAVFAWLLERTDLPYKVPIFFLLLVPSAIPGLIYAIAFVLLLDTHIGAVNIFFASLPLLGYLQFNISSILGMGIVEGLRLVPGSFLMIAAVLRRMNPDLEAAANMAGAGVGTTLRHVTLPLVLPGVLGAYIYYFITSIESFEIPAIIGVPVGIQVFATRLFFAAKPIGGLPRLDIAATWGMFFLLISGVLVFIYARLLRRRESFTSITGKGFRPRLMPLGNWRYVGLGFVGCYFAVAILFPLLILLWASVQPYMRPPSMAALKTLTFSSYVAVWTLPNFVFALRNTLFLIVVSSTLTMILAFAVSWVVVRSNVRGRALIDFLSFTPHAIPTIVMGVGLMILFIFLVDIFPIYGTIWILVVGMVVKRISYATRVMVASMYQIHRELEQAAAVSGANLLKTFWYVTARLVAPALQNGWLYTAINVNSALTIPLLLHTQKNTVLPILIWSQWQDANASMATTLSVITILLTFLLMAVLYGIVRRGERRAGLEAA
ncbi:MAG: ABC transporter permease [Candidatus Binatia bacterium]